jgi:hypothetical protein
VSSISSKDSENQKPASKRCQVRNELIVVQDGVIEHIDDIIADLEQGLTAAARLASAA